MHDYLSEMPSWHMMHTSFYGCFAIAGDEQPYLPSQSLRSNASFKAHDFFSCQELTYSHLQCKCLWCGLDVHYNESHAAVSRPLTTRLGTFCLWGHCPGAHPQCYPQLGMHTKYTGWPRRWQNVVFPKHAPEAKPIICFVKEYKVLDVPVRFIFRVSLWLLVVMQPLHSQSGRNSGAESVMKADRPPGMFAWLWLK